MTSVILAVGKSDLLTNDEYDILVQTALDQCRSKGISLFALADDDAKIFPLTKKFQNKAFKSTAILEDCLIRQYFPHLIERMEGNFYETYRSDKLHQMS